MPEVIVYLVEGRTLEQKRGLVKDITQAVVKNAGTTAEQVTISLVEKRRRSVQRDAGPLSASAKITQSCAEPSRSTPVNKIVSALHNVLAAVQ